MTTSDIKYSAVFRNESTESCEFFVEIVILPLGIILLTYFIVDSGQLAHIMRTSLFYFHVYVSNLISARAGSPKTFFRTDVG